MHELGVTKSIVEVVVRHAERQSANQVQWVQRYFDRCAEGTIAEGAHVSITKVPMAFYCSACGATFQLPMGSDQHMCCSECGSEDYDMITGGELLIQSIEVV